MITLSYLARPKKLIGNKYLCDYDVSDVLVNHSLFGADALKLAICVGDASRCIEACGGTTDIRLIGRRYW